MGSLPAVAATKWSSSDRGMPRHAGRATKWSSPAAHQGMVKLRTATSKHLLSMTDPKRVESCRVNECKGENSKTH